MSWVDRLAKKITHSKTVKKWALQEQFDKMTPARQRLLWTCIAAMQAAENLNATDKLEDQLNEWIRTDKAAYIAAVRERMGIDGDETSPSN